jgi:hypothetical protein
MTLSDIPTVVAGAFEVVFGVVFGVVFEVVFIDIDLLSSPIYRDIDYKKLLADRIIFKKVQKNIPTYQESNGTAPHKAKLMH